MLRLKKCENLLMPRLEYAERFVRDFALITSPRLEQRILSDLDNIEAFGGFGSSNVPASIKKEFGAGVRRVAVNPFDLIYTHYPDQDLCRIEALVHQRTAR